MKKCGSYKADFKGEIQMFKFLNKPEWQLTLRIFSMLTVIKIIFAYINPEVFLTYMHVELTQSFVIAVVAGHLTVKLDNKLKKIENNPVLFWGCIIAGYYCLFIVCEFVMQMALYGSFDFNFLFILFVVCTCTGVIAVIWEIIKKVKNKKTETLS